jgi:hypothetical protein
MQVEVEKGKALAEEIKTDLMSTKWGDIFDPAFNIENIEFNDLKTSNAEWDSSFQNKQFRENVGRA